MNCKHRVLWSSATIFLFFALTAAAKDTAANDATESKPEEITITGQKSRWALEAQLWKAEEAVYETFNKLNDDHQYDVHCSWEIPMNRHIREHVCRPAFLDTATQVEAQAIFGRITGSNVGVPPPVQMEAGRRYPILQQKMKEAVKKSPEMRKAMLEHYELQKTIDEMDGKPAKEQTQAK